MKDFRCRDSGMNCDFVATGATDDEVLRKAGDHAASVHHLEVTQELASRVVSLIHDEDGDEWGRFDSMR